METTTTTEHGHRVTHEYDRDRRRVCWYADCPCGAESGPFDTAKEARTAELDHDPSHRDELMDHIRSHHPDLLIFLRPGSNLATIHADGHRAREVQSVATHAHDGDDCVTCGHARHLHLVARADCHLCGCRGYADEDGSTTASFVSLALVLSFLLPLGVFLVRSTYALAEVL